MAMAAITERRARQQASRYATDADQARTTAGIRRPERATRHSLDSSLRRFADTLDS